MDEVLKQLIGHSPMAVALIIVMWMHMRERAAAAERETENRLQIAQIEAESRTRLADSMERNTTALGRNSATLDRLEGKIVHGLRRPSE